MTQEKSRHSLNSQIGEAAAEWLIAFTEGEVDAKGREAFMAWLRTSPEHVRAYLRIASLWEDDELFARSRKLDADELVRRALAESNVVPLPGPEAAQVATDDAPQTAATPVRRKGVNRLAVAASIMGAALGIGSLVSGQMSRALVYETAIGEQRTVTLSDGSVLSLNARSKVRVKYDEEHRAVELLEGQALFRVASNPQRPFIVRSDKAAIRAVGTQFDVSRKVDKTVVTVVEGRVAVSEAGAAKRGGVAVLAADFDADSAAATGATLVSAGEQVIATATEVTPVRQADVAAATAWMEGKLVFRSLPLVEVIDEFNRHSPRRFVIEDAQLADVRISGIFSFTDTAQLTEFLRERFGVTVRESDGEIRLARH
jgi:transmembrane sensor